MHIERIHKMVECLTEKTLSELDKGIENVNTEEMSEAVDMIKDLCEAEYKAVIVKSMKKADEEEEEYNKELLRALKDEYGEEGGRRYYDEYRYMRTGRYAPKGKGTYVGRRGYEEPPYYHMYPERDMDREYGRMYYTEPTATHTSESGYDRAKRMYTETKEMHKANTPEDKEHKMKSLDSYTKELASDITGMVADMSAEEKNLLRTKLSTLVSKI
jgi:hypothetical protein|nr:MAG TPA: hypothetical protein [Bacteriophage sp.]